MMECGNNKAVVASELTLGAAAYEGGAGARSKSAR